MYPEGRPEGALPLLGMRGRLGSEQGPVGGGCCGRVDAACDEWGGCADPARAVCGKVSGVGLVDGMVTRHDCISGYDSQKSSRREITFVFACFSSSVFIMALVGCNEHADLG